MYDHLPQDIADEKRMAEQLRRHYEHRPFGELRRFSALRQQAPGIIAEFVLGLLVACGAGVILFRDLNAQGLLPVVGASIYIVVVIGLCFWLAGRIWRWVGVEVRDRGRYLVSNMWSLLTTAFVTGAAVVSLVFPEANRLPAPPPPQAAVSPPARAAGGPASHERPMSQRVFAGSDWRILHGADRRYATARVGQAAARCRQLGLDWALADRADFEALEADLKAAGHVGSFWTASKRSNANLDYFLDADGSSRFRWALSAIDVERIVLCVSAASVEL